MSGRFAGILFEGIDKRLGLWYHTQADIGGGNLLRV